MTEVAREELVALIGRMDAAGRLLLRRALVRQAMIYVELLLQEDDHEAERACLAAVGRWLDQPDAPEGREAIEAQLERAKTLDQERLRLDLLGQELHEVAWDAARATLAALPEAARLAAAVAAYSSEWVNPGGPLVGRERRRRVEARRAEAAATRWQLAAARALLAGGEPPPVPALPEPLDDPAEILALFRRESDPRSVYQSGDLRELCLLLSPEQEEQLARHELAQAMACAANLLPPREEDRGERACLSPTQPGPAAARLPGDSLFGQVAAARAAPRELRGLLGRAASALLRARACRRQISMARAVAVGLPLPAEPDKTMLLTGRLAAYRMGDLAQLCAGLDAAGLLRLKQALVGQAIGYAIQLLPGPAGDRGHLAALWEAEEWLGQPHTDPPADRMGPAPAGADRAATMVWKAVRGVTDAARAVSAPALLRALDTVVANTVGTQTQTYPSSQAALNAVYRSKDYQLAAAYLIGVGGDAPPWLGPEPTYSLDSFDAVLRRMSDAQHGLLRWGLIHDCARYVRLGLEAHVRAPAWLPGAWQLVTALDGWAAHPEAGIRGELLAPDVMVEAARRAAQAESEGMGEQLALALDAAARWQGPADQTRFGTRSVAAYCERAIGLAAQAMAERWQLDAAYALLDGAQPPRLAALTIG